MNHSPYMIIVMQFLTQKPIIESVSSLKSKFGLYIIYTVLLCCNQHNARVISIVVNTVRLQKIIQTVLCVLNTNHFVYLLQHMFRTKS